MEEKPKIIHALTLLWLALSGIFALWGVYSLYWLVVVLRTSWPKDQASSPLVPILHFGYLISTIVWFVFSTLFVIFAHATFKKQIWAWTTGIIISTIFLVIFGLMLTAFMINAMMFFDWFSINGLVSVVLSFVADLGIIFFLTRPATKKYFNVV